MTTFWEERAKRLQAQPTPVGKRAAKADQKPVLLSPEVSRPPKTEKSDDSDVTLDSPPTE